MSDKVTRDFASCPCGQRGEVRNRRPYANSRQYRYEVHHENGNRECTVEVRWDTEQARYTTRRVTT